MWAGQDWLERYLIVPGFGPRVRLSALTKAELEATSYIEMRLRCDRYRRCLDTCLAGAISRAGER